MGRNIQTLIDVNKCPDLSRDLASVLNRHSIDSDLATPDFILAEHMILGLENYGQTMVQRAAFVKDPRYATLAPNELARRMQNDGYSIAMIALYLRIDEDVVRGYL